jgi:hypothetical protein
MSDSVRDLRHDIRGRINAMKLCVAALDTPMEHSEAVEFLDDVVRMCDKVASLFDELDRVRPPLEDQHQEPRPARGS